VTLLLDTHVLLWWLADDPRLTPAMREAIADPSTSVVVSAASAWEAAIKAAVGKLRVPDGFRDELTRHGFDELPVTVEDGRAACALPRRHSDPFDRMLIAQARACGSCWSRRTVASRAATC
jgi:PIN domain nuclease of toxin-antitoxin system